MKRNAKRKTGKFVDSKNTKDTGRMKTYIVAIVLHGLTRIKANSPQEAKKICIDNHFKINVEEAD